MTEKRRKGDPKKKDKSRSRKQSRAGHDSRAITH